MRSLQKLAEFYSTRLPETLTVAAWSGKFLVGRLALLEPPFNGKNYAQIAHDLFTDCRMGADRLTGLPFDPPEYAGMVGQFPTVYRLEAIRGFRYAYGEDFAYDAQQFFWHTPAKSEPTVAQFAIGSTDNLPGRQG